MDNVFKLQTFPFWLTFSWDTCGREARTETNLWVVKGKRIPVDGTLKRKKRVLFSSQYRVHTLFQKQFSRTFPETFSWLKYVFPDFKMHNNWSNKPLRNRNPKIILKKIVFKETFITRVYRFPGLSRTCINFPGLSSPGKCQNKIPGLSRISRTRTNPVSNVQSIKMKCVYNYCVERCDIYAPIPSACRFWNVTKSATNRYQSISINLSIVIENRYQSITTRIFAIDWSSIININRLIDIDWYWLISIVTDYRFHRLDTPGLIFVHRIQLSVIL